MFKVSPREEIDKVCDDARDLEDEDKDDEAQKLFDKANKMETELDAFFDDKCDMFHSDYNMKDIADNFIILYQEFGFVKLKKILVFINDALKD